MRYLFDSLSQAYNPESATRAGFTHLIANAKKSQIIATRLEDRVKQDYPESFQRCIQFSRYS
jgi:transcriptional regulatory protein LevR